MRKRLLVVLLIAAVGLALIVCAISGMPTQDAAPKPTRTPRATNTPAPTRTPTPDVGDQWGAIAVCKKFIADNLVAPASAKYGTPETSLLDADTETWRVMGYVDAQNKMGAMLRLTYRCEVSYQGGDMWNLVDLDIVEP